MAGGGATIVASLLIMPARANCQPESRGQIAFHLFEKAMPPATAGPAVEFQVVASDLYLGGTSLGRHRQSDHLQDAADDASATEVRFLGMFTPKRNGCYRPPPLCDGAQMLALRCG